MKPLFLLLALAVAACHREPPPALLRLDTLDEVSALTRDRKGPLLVHFWAQWCEACMEEMPRMAKLARTAQSKGAQVVWVNADGYSKEAQVGKQLAGLKASSLARHYLLNMELDADAVAARFDSEWHGVLPATFAYNAGGGGKHRVLGPSSPEEETKLLRALTSAPSKD